MSSYISSSINNNLSLDSLAQIVTEGSRAANAESLMAKKLDIDAKVARLHDLREDNLEKSIEARNAKPNPIVSLFKKIFGGLVAILPIAVPVLKVIPVVGTLAAASAAVVATAAGVTAGGLEIGSSVQLNNKNNLDIELSELSVKLINAEIQLESDMDYGADIQTSIIESNNVLADILTGFESSYRNINSKIRG